MTSKKALKFAKELKKLVESYDAELYLYNSDLTAELVLGDVNSEVSLATLSESKDKFVDTTDIIDNLA